MNPTPGDLHVNQLLTNVSIAFNQAQDNFIATKVFPVVPSQKQSDRYAVFNRGDFNRDEMQVRAPATESAGGGYRVDTTPTFYCNKKAYHKDVDDDSRANADSVFNQDSGATKFVTLKALINREKTWVGKFFAAGLWTTDVTGVAATPSTNQVLQWSDGNSTPIEDIRTGKRVVLESTGIEPNKLVVGQATWDQLADHPAIIDRVKYGQTAGSPAKVTREALAALLELDEILVMKAVENTAKEGSTASSHSFIGGKKALLCYAAPEPQLEMPSAGYTFAWTGYMGATADGTRIKRFRMEELAADRIEIEQAIDQKLIAADLGYFWDTIVA